jgi:hypothetical protein
VETYYWNHPLLLDTLREELPQMRALVSAVITGTSAPQVLMGDLGRYADALVIRVDGSRGTECLHVAMAASSTTATRTPMTRTFGCGQAWSHVTAPDRTRA